MDCETPATPSLKSALHADPTCGVAWHRPDDRFIPVRASELIPQLCADAGRFGLDAQMVGGLAQVFQDVIEQEAGAFERALADVYALVNPDRDTQLPADVAQRRTPDLYRSLHTQLTYLLRKANFRRLDAVQVDRAICTAKAYGLRIRLNPERIERLEVWVRGRGATTQCGRSWRHPFHGIVAEIPLYRRLAVVARLRNDPHVLIKLFKDIPEAGVEALLPHAEVAMDWRDRLLVFGGGAGALGSSAGKILGFVKGVVFLSQLAWVLLVGFAGLAVRAFFGYRRARASRDSRRTQHLYFQNLANNAGRCRRLSPR